LSTQADLQVIRGWCIDEPDELLARVRQSFTYGPGDNRATGQLYAAGEQDWVPALAVRGPELLDDLAVRYDVKFTIVAFQSYRNGAGCDWHTDEPFDAQAILSLGVTRTLGVRPVGGEPEWIPVGHGDLVYMPPGYQVGHEHCVPAEDVTGERCSLVFRTVVRS
jgi:alkylated DNA repair dioxygenase AlkB